MSLAVAALAWVLTQAPAAPPDAPTPAAQLVARTSSAERVEQLLEDGRHVRFGTDGRGPVHLWWPRTYRPATAVTVVYLHGYYTDVDQAFLQHQLATQFRDSGKNALFVVPQAPSSWKDEVHHPELGALLELVKEQGRVELPRGGVTAVGHSGAYRTLVRWLGEPALERVLLVDGLYAGDKELEQWLAGGRGRQLVLVGFETTQRTQGLLKKHPAAVRLDDVPWMYDAPPPTLKKAPLAFIDAQRLDHMGLITSGRVLPWLLRALLP